ncbi:hypothetical protein E2542_SST17478 [Spatholobus suberectus]|nr:hypothetical protein E2542_SST17478 [Spatholobus suberectus]
MVGQNKRTLLVVFFILCFISIHARARTFKEKSNMVSTRDPSTAHHRETHDHVYKPKEGKDHASEVFSMDYTPVRRKPPIHNLN